MPGPEYASDFSTLSETPTADERRTWPRVAAGRLSEVRARLTTGGDVTLLDLSRSGARLESARRMLPNSSVSLTFVTPDANVVMTGVVVRSRIVRLASGLGYDVAVAFNDLVEDIPQLTAVASTPASAPEGSPADEDVPPAPEVHAVEAPGPRPAAESQTMFHITAELGNGEYLHDLIAGNGW
jgi:hypothetical protein